MVTVAAIEGIDHPAHGEDMFYVDLPAFVCSKVLATVEGLSAFAVKLGPEQGDILEIFGVWGSGVCRRDGFDEE